MKHLEGCKVYLTPTGNNSRRYSGEYIEAEIKKVNRVNIIIVIHSREEQYRFSAKKMTISNDCNSGFKVYESAQAVKDQNKADEIASNIHRDFPWSQHWAALGLSKLRRILEIIEE